MNFYCQLNYEHVPYVSPTSPNGNIANNGCGVCCASMIVEALTGKDFPPEESAILAKQSGAREGFGTDMRIYAPAFAEAKGLFWKSTLDTDEVYDFLEKGKGLVIANTIGDREDWVGVFSDSRHYIVLAGAENGEVKVWDPMLKEGRYDREGVKGKVRLDGFDAYSDFYNVIRDCETKPYYLFWKE
ncbi:MAG: C39 family peptidase [Clostridia bacterium]|nr:C39 family peptidase [Clostridia bacterium]